MSGNLTVAIGGSLVRLLVELRRTSDLPKRTARRRRFKFVSGGRGFVEVERESSKSGTTNGLVFFRPDDNGILTPID